MQLIIYCQTLSLALQNKIIDVVIFHII